MSKLWIFGDSYGVHVEQDPSLVNKWFWGYEVAKKLQCQYYNNQSQMGVSNEYIQYLMMQNEKNISCDDYVIVISTSISRRWFFKEFPQLSNYYIENIREFLQKDQYVALEYYIRHLYNPEADLLNMHRFLGWIHYMTQLRQWNLLLIPGFESDGYPIGHKYMVKGSLYDVSFNEFENDDDVGWYYHDYCQGRDKRSGHISKINHEILADKIYQTFTDNVCLDLNENFTKKIISHSSIDNIQDQFPSISAQNGIIKGIRFNEVI